jgi:hypothetical protein
MVDKIVPGVSGRGMVVTCVGRSFTEMDIGGGEEFDHGMVFVSGGRARVYKLMKIKDEQRVLNLIRNAFQGAECSHTQEQQNTLINLSDFIF